MATFKSKQFDYDGSGNIIYMGEYPEAGVSYTNNGWYIKKFSYDANGFLIRIEGPLRGSWSNREALDWR